MFSRRGLLEYDIAQRTDQHNVTVRIYKYDSLFFFIHFHNVYFYFGQYQFRQFTDTRFCLISYETKDSVYVSKNEKLSNNTCTILCQINISAICEKFGYRMLSQMKYISHIYSSTLHRKTEVSMY